MTAAAAATAVPGPATPTAELSIDAGDIALYAESFAPSNKGTPTGVVVITHGYAEHCGRYREVAHVIADAGWAALSYDVRGHGQSPGPRGYVDHFATYLRDFAAVRKQAAKLAPAGAPMVLLGHSHGSLITLRALCDEHPPDGVVAAIVASPYLGLRLAVPGYKKLLARVASRVAPGLEQPSGLRIEDLTNDAGKRAERAADTRCFDIATARWFVESSRAQDEVYARAGKIRVPVTWLVGADDPIANPAQSRRVADRVPASTYNDLRGMKHEVFNEVDRAKVFAEVTRVLATAGTPKQ
jgi:alpha-beta hydrolase superfamily lysophospholipase